MKVLYTSDLHGEIHLYHELFEITSSFSAKIIALGGDLFPSFPPTNRYKDIIPSQKIFINEFLLPFFKKILQRTTIKQIFLIPGNWDLSYPYLFKEPVEGIIDLDRRSHRLENGYEFIGYPFVPPTPFRPKEYEKMDDPEAPWPPQKNPSYVRSPDQADQLIAVDPYLYLKQRETIGEDLNRLAKPLDYKKTIYMMHSPPLGTRLDLIQGKQPGGSRSIKTFIEKNQPLLTLHGHIHESPELSGGYFDRIGETLSINPGQVINKGGNLSKLHAVTFDIKNPSETLTHTCFKQN
jgi:Icc-related predicted phosphoesterase